MAISICGLGRLPHDSVPFPNSSMMTRLLFVARVRDNATCWRSTINALWIWDTWDYWFVVVMRRKWESTFETVSLVAIRVKILSVRPILA
jgi:hypothetical protein